MKAYENLNDFLNDLPALTAAVRDKLAGHDNLFCVQTEQRTIYIRLQNGLASVSDQSDGIPVCTINAKEGKLLGLITGKENPAKLLLFGGVKVKGDMKPLLKLISLL